MWKLTTKLLGLLLIGVSVRSIHGLSIELRFGLRFFFFSFFFPCSVRKVHFGSKFGPFPNRGFGFDSGHNWISRFASVIYDKESNWSTIRDADLPTEPNWFDGHSSHRYSTCTNHSSGYGARSTLKWMSRLSYILLYNAPHKSGIFLQPTKSESGIWTWTCWEWGILSKIPRVEDGEIDQNVSI